MHVSFKKCFVPHTAGLQKKKKKTRRITVEKEDVIN